MDLPTARAVEAERAVSRRLGGSCQVPLGAFAECTGERMRLRGFVASPDGRRLLAAEVHGAAASPEALGTELADRLRGDGAEAILDALDKAG
jgi:hydroxymethylbilane synthase